MRHCPSGRQLVRGSFFLFITGSRTLVSIGHACLTVDSTFLALNCLIQYHYSTIHYSKSVSVSNIVSQIIAATFSISLIMITRYPAILDKLSSQKLREKIQELKDSVSDISKKKKFLLGFIAIFGLLSCFARGMSAYLGVEVILGERAQINSNVVNGVGWLAAIPTTISSLCFNYSNMLAEALKYLKNPTISFRLSVMVALMATISNAVATRFFIMHFLDRRGG